MGSWQVTGLLSGDAFKSPLGGTELTATFGEDGIAQRVERLQHLHVEYTTDKGAIEIAAVAGTKKACAEPAGVMEQEASYLALLPHVP